MTTLEQAARQALDALEESQKYVEASANAKLLDGWGDQLDKAEATITALRQALERKEQYTYTSTQATTCAGCGKHKHTPLRIDAMGGYVCLTCIDKKLGSLLGEFGYSGQPKQEPTGKKYLQVEQLLIDMLDTLPYNAPDYWIGRIKEVMPLYTEPPKREPLTDEQVEKIIKSNMSLQMNLAGIRADFEAAHGIKENT